MTAITVTAQPGPEAPSYVETNYDKQEVLIPMRDGARMFTAIYTPKDQSKAYPIVMRRTPYSVRPYGEDQFPTSIGPNPMLMQDGYIVVYQDVRGKYMSEGDFMAVNPHKPDKRGPEDVDESTDTWDTVDWLLKNVDNHNGRVGVWGISAPGFYATHALIDSHPAIKAVSPQAPVTDWWLGDDRHHNGAFQMQASFSFLSGYGAPRPEPTQNPQGGFRDYGTPDGYRWYMELGPLSNVNEKYFHGENETWNGMMDHPDYDEFWQARTPLPHLKNVKPAVLVVGGFFDAQDLYGPLKTYGALESQNPGLQNHLVMGPWRHGGWSRGDGDRYSDLYFEQKTGVFFRENIERPFFNYFLKDEGALNLNKASIFVTGSNRWHFFESWPPPASQSASVFLQKDGKLSFDAPNAEDGFVEYTSDPAKPVPHTPQIGVTRDDGYVVQDQRFSSTRPDVVVFESEPLEKDITLTGELFASLFVSTSGTDADYIVKLIDVHPGDAICALPEGDCAVPAGHFQQLVRAEVMRARYRNSFEKPEPMTPGQIYPVTFDMQDVAHTFKAGHRMMVHVQSTWFPMVDRNTQNYIDNLYYAKESDYRVATHRVHFSKDHPSSLQFRILE